jgi:hypothetical protein
MGGKLKFELREDLSEILRRLSQITGRTITEVLSDAIRTYVWILREQSAGRSLHSQDGTNPPVRLTDLIVDSEKAKAFFRTLAA